MERHGERSRAGAARGGLVPGVGTARAADNTRCPAPARTRHQTPCATPARPRRQPRRTSTRCAYGRTSSWTGRPGEPTDAPGTSGGEQLASPRVTRDARTPTRDAHDRRCAPSRPEPARAPDPARDPGHASRVDTPDGDTAATSALPTPLAPSAGSPSAHDLRLFETSATAPLPQANPGAGDAGGDGRPPRRRKGVLLSAGRSGRGRDRRGGIRERTVLVRHPVAGRGAAGRGPGERAGPVDQRVLAERGTERVVRPAVAHRVRLPVRVPVGQCERLGLAVPVGVERFAHTVPRPAEPTRSTTAPPVDAPQESEDDGDPGGGPTLRRGDQGPEVVELQQRLAQKWMYWGDSNGNYNRQVEDAVRQYQWERGIHTDGVGVYGPDTRRSLESETREP
ncbi:hypothetical protein STENM327S_02091 [Streptomyces tendae]